MYTYTHIQHYHVCMCVQNILERHVPELPRFTLDARSASACAQHHRRARRTHEQTHRTYTHIVVT